MARKTKNQRKTNKRTNRRTNRKTNKRANRRTNRRTKKYFKNSSTVLPPTNKIATNPSPSFGNVIVGLRDYLNKKGFN